MTARLMAVIPAEAGIQSVRPREARARALDPHLRGDDEGPELAA